MALHIILTPADVRRGRGALDVYIAFDVEDLSAYQGRLGARTMGWTVRKPRGGPILDLLVTYQADPSVAVTREMMTDIINRWTPHLAFFVRHGVKRWGPYRW